MNDWLRVTAIGGDDYECRMTVRKADDTTITVTRPWHHHWTDGWDWKTIIRQWLSDMPETFEPYDGLAEWLRDADAERIDCWHCLSWLANHQRSAVEFLSDAEKKRLASRWACRRGGGRTTLGDAARKRKRHHGRGTRRMGGTQNSQTTAAKRGRQVSVRSETLGEVIDWLGDEADREWERAKDGLSDGYGGFDAYTRTIQHCQDMLMDDTAEHGKPDEGGKMNKQNETVLLEHLADTFETKLRKADRSIGTDIPDPYREGRMDALGWAATYCRLLAERESPTTPDASGWSKSAYLRTAPSSTCTTRTERH